MAAGVTAGWLFPSALLQQVQRGHKLGPRRRRPDRHEVSAVYQGPLRGLPEAFRDAFIMLDRRIGLFLCLPLASLDALAIKSEIDRIGRE